MWPSSIRTARLTSRLPGQGSTATSSGGFDRFKARVAKRRQWQRIAAGSAALVATAAAFSILTRAFSAVAPSGPGSAIPGRSLAVVVFKHPFAEAGPRTSPVHRIFTVGTDGSGAEPMTPGDADYFHPAWASDGTRLAVVRFERDGEQLDEAIYVIDRKTGEQQRFLTTGDPRPVSVLDIEWSGSKIGFVYARHGEGGEWDPPRAQILVMPAPEEIRSHSTRTTSISGRAST
jgi:dipeptidyl aminopeptidase/acylaminoacyl peptidase